jgi:Flp pilus assembly protein TadD
LNELGLLKTVLAKVANEGHVDGIDFYKNKSRSYSYCECLSRNLLQRNHFNWALSVIDFAITLYGNLAQLHSQKSAVLDGLGRTELAIASMEKAMELAPGNPVIKHRAGLLLAKHGAIEKAIKIIEDALILDPNNFPNKNLLSFLLNKRGI